MSHDHHRLLDAIAWALGGLAVFGFWQGVALALTILAALGSLSLVGLRWYVFFKYGPQTQVPE
jgi:hypothetical protein